MAFHLSIIHNIHCVFLLPATSATSATSSSLFNLQTFYFLFSVLATSLVAFLAHNRNIIWPERHIRISHLKLKSQLYTHSHRKRQFAIFVNKSHFTSSAFSIHFGAKVTQQQLQKTQRWQRWKGESPKMSHKRKMFNVVLTITID